MITSINHAVYYINTLHNVGKSLNNKLCSRQQKTKKENMLIYYWIFFKILRYLTLALSCRYDLTWCSRYSTSQSVILLCHHISVIRHSLCIKSVRRDKTKAKSSELFSYQIHLKSEPEHLVWELQSTEVREGLSGIQRDLKIT